MKRRSMVREEAADGLILRSVVYWGVEEVASAFSARGQP
jgi:hypothetical protein